MTAERDGAAMHLASHNDAMPEPGCQWCPPDAVTAPEVPHADLIARLDDFAVMWRDSDVGILLRHAHDALAALGDTVPRDDDALIEARAERDALAHVIEQVRAWRSQHGSGPSGILLDLDVVLNGESCWACARKTPTADMPSGDIALCNSHWNWWVIRWIESEDDPPCSAHLITAPAVSLALHDAELKAQALDEAAAAMADLAGGRAVHVPWLVTRAAAIREEAGQ